MSHENETSNVPVPEEPSVKNIIESLRKQSVQFQADIKLWNKNLQVLEKEMDRETKKASKTRVKRKVNQKPQQVTDKMQKFMKKFPPTLEDGQVLEHNGMYTRQVMMKAVSGYIKSSGIQNVDNKKQWGEVLNGAKKVLTPIFDLKEDWYTFMQINGLLSRVVIKE